MDADEVGLVLGRERRRADLRAGGEREEAEGQDSEQGTALHPSDVAHRSARVHCGFPPRVAAWYGT